MSVVKAFFEFDVAVREKKLCRNSFDRDTLQPNELREKRRRPSRTPWNSLSACSVALARGGLGWFPEMKTPGACFPQFLCEIPCTTLVGSTVNER
jgi:hypothetical protein